MLAETLTQKQVTTIEERDTRRHKKPKLRWLRTARISSPL
jgi:hypothetical protein